MPFPTAHTWGKTQTILAVAAAVSWGVALWEAAPRLLAGPICSSAGDLWVLTGHCPACPVAFFATLALLASLALRRRDGRKPAAATARHAR